MLRSNSVELYGWNILLAGTAWPGWNISHSLGLLIKLTAESDHEAGLHAWDYHSWRMHTVNWSDV